MPPVLDCKVQIGMAEALREVGLSPTAVLEAARLSPDLLNSPGPRVSVREYFALWRAIETLSGDRSTGIKLVALIKLDLTEPMFLGVLSAEDVAGAIDLVSRYKRIFEPQGLDIRRDPVAGEVVVTLPEPDSEADQPQILIDTQLAFIVEMCRRGTRQAGLSPRRVDLRAEILASSEVHNAYFRCPIRLGAPTNALVFAADDMSRPFLTHNPQLQRALIPYLAAQTPSPLQSPMARVRAVISARIRGRRPTLQSVARELAMSGRAIQRVLRDQGTTFRRLLDDVRNEQARGYLTATSYSDAEVAFLVGFEEANSFHRAFRAWNGVSPSEFRRRVATSPVGA